MAEPKIIVADDNDQVASELIKIIREKYDANGGNLVVGLSGGSLPKFFAAGSQTEVGKNVDWSKVKFIFCDERLVDVSNPDSTLGVYLDKMKGIIPEDNYVRVDTGLDVAEAAEDYERKMKALAGDQPRFDVLLLGMGPDGHTCSLFPGHPLLNETVKIVAPISDSPKPPPKRVTLTLPVLNNAKAVVFVSTGEGKKEVIEKVLKNKDEQFPATRVRPTTGDLFWILDKPAASNL